MSFPKKLLLNLGITLAVIACLIVLLVIFNKNLESVSGKTRELNQEIITRSNSIQKISELQTAYNGTTGAYLNVLYNVIPQKDELINLSKEIQTVAASENLSFGFSFLGENPPSGDTLGYVSFSISLGGGSINSIVNFIKKMERFRYFVQLEDFSVGSEGGTTTIRGRVFFR